MLACFFIAAQLAAQPCTPTVRLPAWTAHLVPLDPDEDRSILFVDAPDENTIWATAFGTTFLRSADGGCHWMTGSFDGSLDPVSVGVTQILGIDSMTAWISVYDLNPHLYKTTDGGQTWTDVLCAGCHYVEDIHFFNASDGILVSDVSDGYYEIYTTTNKGDSWTRVPQQNIPPVAIGEYGFYSNRFAVAGDTIWIATVSKGFLLRSIDKGYHWELFNPAPVAQSGIFALAFRDALHGLFMSHYQGFWRTEDGGATWVQLNAVPSITGDFLENIPGTKTYLLSHTTNTLFTLDEGENWHVLDHQLYEIDFPNPGTGWAGAYGQMREWNAKTALVHSNNLPYAVVKANQAGVLKRTARLIDFYSTGFDANLEWTVSHAGNTLASQTDFISVPPAIVLDAPEFSYNPVDTGIYTFKLKASRASNGEVLVDDSKSILLSPTLISKADNEMDLRRNIPKQTEFATQIELIQQDTLSALSLFFAGASIVGGPVNCSLWFNIYKVSDITGLPELLVYAASPLNLSAADVNTWVTKTLSPGVALPPGQYAIAFKFSFDTGSHRAVGTDTDHYEFTSWEGYNGLWTSHPDKEVAAIMLRAHFDPSGVSSAAAPVASTAWCTVSPNPASGKCRIIVSDSMASNTDVQVFACDGTLVLEKHSIGKDDAVDLSSNAAGMYFFKIISNNKVALVQVAKF